MPVTDANGGTVTDSNGEQLTVEVTRTVSLAETSNAMHGNGTQSSSNPGIGGVADGTIAAPGSISIVSALSIGVAVAVGLLL